MSKYLKNSNIKVDEYISYLGEKNNKTKDNIIKEYRNNISKRYLLCNNIKKIFGNVCISEDAINTLTYIFALKDMNTQLFLDKLVKAYPLVITYPELSPDFIKEILPFYNARIFEELDLFTSLDYAIKTKKDSDFEYVINKSVLQKIKYDDKWENDAIILDIYKDEYSNEYIEYLKDMAIKYYIDYGNIILSMPSSSLVCKDEKLVSNINDIYDTDIIPLSYRLTIDYATHKDLCNYKDLYYETPDETIMASFNLDDYLNDINRNNKTLTK